VRYKTSFLFYQSGAKVRLGAIEITALHRFNRTKPYTALIEQNLAGVGFCKLVLVKSAVQKSAVGSAKNGGRGLEKNPIPIPTNGTEITYLVLSYHY
jgi:hypothetical protein